MKNPIIIDIIVLGSILFTLLPSTDSLKIEPTGNYKVIVYDKVKMLKGCHFMKATDKNGEKQKFIMSSAFGNLKNIFKHYKVYQINESYDLENEQLPTRLIPELAENVDVHMHILPVYKNVCYKNSFYIYSAYANKNRSFRLIA